MADPQDTIDQLASEAITSTPAAPEKYSDPYFSRKAVVYFIAAGTDPIRAVKIGVTARDKVSTRLRSIQSANHERIELLKVIEFLSGEKPGLQAERREAELHKEFAALQRAKPRTVGCEWFDYDQPLADFIASQPPLPDDLEKIRKV